MSGLAFYKSINYNHCRFSIVICLQRANRPMGSRVKRRNDYLYYSILYSRNLHLGSLLNQTKLTNRIPGNPSRRAKLIEIMTYFFDKLNKKYNHCLTPQRLYYLKTMWSITGNQWPPQSKYACYEPIYQYNIVPIPPTELLYK